MVIVGMICIDLVLCLWYYRLGHQNFQLINHDVVEPLMIEGEWVIVRGWGLYGVVHS